MGGPGNGGGESDPGGHLAEGRRGARLLRGQGGAPG